MTEQTGVRDRSTVVTAGLVGTLGAFLVCIGEFAMQFSPEGGYESIPIPESLAAKIEEAPG